MIIRARCDLCRYLFESPMVSSSYIVLLDWERNSERLLSFTSNGIFSDRSQRKLEPSWRRLLLKCLLFIEVLKTVACWKGYSLIDFHKTKTLLASWSIPNSYSSYRGCFRVQCINFKIFFDSQKFFSTPLWLQWMVAATIRSTLLVWCVKNVSFAFIILHLCWTFSENNRIEDSDLLLSTMFNPISSVKSGIAKLLKNMDSGIYKLIILVFIALVPISNNAFVFIALNKVKRSPYSKKFTFLVWLFHLMIKRNISYYNKCV